MLKMSIWTSVMNGTLFVFALKILHYLQFISWKPVKFLDLILFVRLIGKYEKWAVLWLMIVLISFILYWLASFLKRFSSFWISIVFGILCFFIVALFFSKLHLHWGIVKELSIPFLVIVMMSCRFIVETSIFFGKANN